MSLGVSVDITKAAVKNARIVIAQVNRRMPRVHGDAFVHLDDVDAVVRHDEELPEYTEKSPDEIADRIGSYVSPIIRDGDTIQVGYGSLPKRDPGPPRAKETPRHTHGASDRRTGGPHQVRRRG